MTDNDFTILIVDDEVNLREGLRAGLEDQATKVVTAENAEEALELFRHGSFSVVISDIQMPGLINGLELLEQVIQLQPQTTVIIITAYGTVDLAVQAMRLGAYDFVTKPIDLDLIRHQVQKAREFRLLRDENRNLRTRLADAGELSNIIGNSAAMQRVFHQVRQVAGTDATVLIQGESGTGKELIARSLHDLSERNLRPFVAVNLGALPDTLLEAEMFGYEKGAFSGSVRQKPGFFEQAKGGTLFLDEVTEMSTKSQVDLLRVLESQQFHRLGGEELIESDVRVVAATNRKMGPLIREGVFREDLYYRLNVFPIQLPSLRQRREDIPLLVEHFLNHFRHRYSRHVEGFTPEAMQTLICAPWPGNVRQLRNVIERIVIVAQGPRVGIEELPEELNGSTPDLSDEVVVAPVALNDLVADCETEAIKAALAANDGHREKAARQLGISLRTIHNKMSRYGIS